MVLCAMLLISFTFGVSVAPVVPSFYESSQMISLSSECELSSVVTVAEKFIRRHPILLTAFSWRTE